MTDIDKIIDGKLEMLKASCEQAINDGNADESFLTALRLAYEEIIAALRCSEPDEIAEFQQSVYTLCEKFYPEVDGAGSDTGDWRDFTLAEIRQTLNHVAERQPSSDQVLVIEELEKDAARYRWLAKTMYRTSEMEPAHWCIPEWGGLGETLED